MSFRRGGRGGSLRGAGLPSHEGVLEPPPFVRGEVDHKGGASRIPAMEIGAAAHQKIHFPCQRQERLVGGRGITGAEGLDAVQARLLELEQEGSEGVRGLPLAGQQRMGQESESARAMQNADGRVYGSASVLRPILRLRHAVEGPARLPAGPGIPGVCPPMRPDPGQKTSEFEVLGVETVAQQMHRFTVGSGQGQLHPADDPDSMLREDLPKGIEPLHRIVVGQRRHPHAHRRQPLGQAFGRQFAVAQIGVAMQIDWDGGVHLERIRSCGGITVPSGRITVNSPPVPMVVFAPNLRRSSSPCLNRKRCEIRGAPLGWDS
jgi:hypothetical protein